MARLRLSKISYPSNPYTLPRKRHKDRKFYPFPTPWDVDKHRDLSRLTSKASLAEANEDSRPWVRARKTKGRTRRLRSGPANRRKRKAS